MVSFDHLSYGSSLSSDSSRSVDNFEIPSLDSGEADGLALLSSPLVDRRDPDVVLPFLADASSDKSVHLDSKLGDLGGADVSQIFRAAHHFSHSDRVAVVEERKKNKDLMAFIMSFGKSLDDVNDFVRCGAGSPSNVVASDPHRSDLKGIFGDSRSHLPSVEVKSSGSDNDVNPSSLGPVAIMPQSSKSSKSIGIDSSDKCLDEMLPLKSGVFPPAPDASARAFQTGDKHDSWSSIVARSPPSSCSLSFHPPIVENGEVMIKPPNDILQKGNGLWNSSLVGFFLNSRLPFKMVEENAFKLWGQFGLQKVFLHEKGYFIFKFNSGNARDNVLAMGPWFFSNKMMILKHWKEGIDLQAEKCTKSPVWVKFHHIPLSYWTSEGLSYLASGIGKPLFLDKLTEKLEPMNFARICIEVNVDSIFHDHLMVSVFDEEANSTRLVEVKVEYQSKPQSCSNCKVFGHSLLRCPQANFKWVPKVAASSSQDRNLGLKTPSSISQVVENVGSESVNPVGLDHPLDDWTTVDKGKARASGSPCPVTTPVSNSFIAIADSLEVSSPDVTPFHNPLIDKLKLVDEKEGRDLKLQAGSDSDCAPISKKKNKRSGGKGGKNP